MKKILIKNTRRGFTLIELLVVVAIIALISSVVMSNVASARMKAADTKITEDLRQVKLAAEMYFIDYRDYPPVTSGTGFNVFEKNKTASLNSKLAFFTKTVEAQSSSRHTTPLCANFDNMAQVLVDKKYIPSIPVHPYDNDSAGICYKAVKKDKTFISYAVLTQHVSTNTSGNVANKRTGFIVGDTSQAALQEVANSGSSLWGSGEDPYPMNVDGQFAFNESGGLESSLDFIEGITTGAPAIDGGGFNIPSLLPPLLPPSNPPVVPPSPCSSGWNLIVDGVAPSSPKCALIPTGDPYAGMELNERLNYATFACTTGQVWVIDGLQNTRYGNCVAQ